jgi:sugar O-acyltransferase (sialic acid O-acetyltransferase NeuD family)
LSTLLVLGAGGHGRVVADAALREGRWRAVSATDRDAARCSGELLPGVPVAPLALALPAACAVHVAIGDAQAREAETQAVGRQRLATVIHPDASVSIYSQIGAGCFVAARSVIAPHARLGISVIVNHGAVVDHDVQVDDFCHIAPNATLGGNVRLGKRVLVGSGASVLPGVSICDDATIGAGTVVHASITGPGVYAGVPARRVR